MTHKETKCNHIEYRYGWGARVEMADARSGLLRIDLGNVEPPLSRDRKSPAPSLLRLSHPLVVLV